MGGAKKNHVIQRALQTYAEPPGPGELICQAQGSRGGNKVDVLLPDGDQVLVTLPAKFRKQIWIRKGSFVIVQVTLDEEDAKGERRFHGEIVRVLLKDDEKHLRALDGGAHWPARWSLNETQESVRESDARGVDPREGDSREGSSEMEGENADDTNNSEARGPLGQTSADGLDSEERASSESEEELPEHLQRISNRRRVQYQDDTSDSD